MSSNRIYTIPKADLRRNLGRKKVDQHRITSAEAWFDLLFKCSRSLETSIAQKILKNRNKDFLELLGKDPNNFDFLKLATSTPTLPLAVRQSAARTLYLNHGHNKNQPPQLIIKRNWEYYAKPMTKTMRNFMMLAIENSMTDALQVVRGDGIHAKNDAHTEKNTVVVYIHPTHFAENAPATLVPYQTLRRVFDLIVQVLFEEGLYVLPMVQPFNNLVVEKDFENYPMICHHTMGKRANTLHVKSAYIDNYAYLDQAGYGPFTAILPKSELLKKVSAVDSMVAETFYDTVLAPYCDAKKSNLHQGTQSIKFDKSKEYFFFAMQTIDDTVIRETYMPPMDAINAILEHFRHTNKILLIKKHPKDHSRTTREFLLKVSCHKNCLIARSNVHDLIAKSSATICINSGVGMEALLHLKPVISLGKSDYQDATHVARTVDELIGILDSKQLAPDRSSLKKFLWYFFNEHLCAANDKQAVRDRLQYLDVVKS